MYKKRGLDTVTAVGCLPGTWCFSPRDFVTLFMWGGVLVVIDGSPAAIHYLPFLRMLLRFRTLTSICCSFCVTLTVCVTVFQQKLKLDTWFNLVLGVLYPETRQHKVQT